MASKRKPSSRSADLAAASDEGAAVAVTVSQGAVSFELSGTHRLAAGTYDILLDGEPAGELVIDKPRRSITVPLPPNRLPTTLDLVDAATGRRPFAAPLALDAAWTPLVDRATIGDACLTVEFTLGPVAMAAVSVVATGEDGAILAAGLAQRDDVDATGRSQYRCALPLITLPRLNLAQAVRLFVGGRPIERAIWASPYACGLVGYVERASQEGISGWAADLRDPARKLTIDAVVGDQVLGTVCAADERPDLATLGLGTAIGFSIPASVVHRLQDGDGLSIVIAGTPTNLVNSPMTMKFEASIRGTFDNIDGNQACGWVIDKAHPNTPCVVEAICDDRVIGTAVANGIRRDVLEAGWPTDRCGYRITFDEPLHTLLGRDIRVRIQGTEVILNGGPKQPKLNANIRQYLTPDRGIAPGTIRRLRARIARRTAGGGISIIMPVHNTRREWLVEALRSVCTQWCDRWELICVDDASTEPHVAMVLAWFAQTEPRIRVIRASRNLGIAGATTLGIEAARQPYVALMDHDDVLEPDAVYQLIMAAQETDADVLYSDEALTGEDISVVLDVRARPAFSHDYYLSHPYFVHLVAVRTAIAQRIGGFDTNLKVSADVDFILRAIEQSRCVVHVPHVLYRWRTHTTSTGHDTKGQVMQATTAAIQRHLDRVAPGATARAAPEFNQFEVRWPDPGGRVLIVIPTKDGVTMLRQCIQSIETTTPATEYRLLVIDHDSKDPASKAYLAEIAHRHSVMPYSGVFNYALMNNCAVRSQAGAEPFLLFMNNDIEALEPGWLQRMRSLAARPDIGAVGTLLMYSDKRSQHGGVIIGINGLADHALRFEAVWDQDGLRNIGYNASLTSVRDFSAVTAACMMMRTAIFEEVGGFDESFAVGFNDTDLCLRIGRAGYRILYDGRTTLFHHESVTRIAEAQLKHPQDDQRLRDLWGHLLKHGDPYYSPTLALYGRDHVLRLGPCGLAAPRSVRVTMGQAALPKAAFTPSLPAQPLVKPRKGRAASRPVAVTAD